MALRPLVIAVSVALGLGAMPSVGAQPAPAPASLTFATPDGLFRQRLGEGRQPLLEAGSGVTAAGLIDAVAWSPQGEALAVVSAGQVFWLNPGTGQATSVFTSHCPQRLDLKATWHSPHLLIQEQCADANGQGEWAVFLTDISGQRQPLPLPQADSALYPSPDGRQIAYVAGQHLYALALDASVPNAAADSPARPTPQQLTATPGTYAAAGSALVWSPDGRKLAFHEGDYPFQRIQVIDLATGEQRLLTPEADFQIYRSRLLWSPDGRYLAFYEPANPPFSNHEVVVALDVATGERQVLTRPGFYNALSWSPDSQTLAFSSGDHWEQQALFTFTLADQAFVTLTPQPFQTVQDSWWSPQGDWIAFTAVSLGDDLGTQRLYIVRPDGNQLTPLTQPTEYTFPVTWQP